MKKCRSSQNIVPQVTVAEAFPQTFPQQYEDHRTEDGRQEFYLAMTSAPAHVVGICMMENPDGVSGVLEQERVKNIASCIASPCEPGECPVVNIDGIRRTMYILADENRAGEMLSRIRKFRRDQKGQLLQ
jgi:hypothetical protein